MRTPPSSSALRAVPVCKVSVDGQPLELTARARLVRARVELDKDLIAESSLLFVDPDFEFLGGAVFKASSKITVKLGFGAQPGQVFAGEVVRLEPQFRRDEPPALLVICQEPLHRLALAQNTRSLHDVDTAQVVSLIAQSHGLSASAPSGSKEHVLQNNVSDAALLRQLASRLGLQVRLEDRELSLGPSPRTAPLPLSLGDGVKKLRVTRKSGQLREEVAVHGWDERQKREIVGRARPQGPTGKAARDHGVGTLAAAGRLLPGDVATAEAMAGGQMKKLAEGAAVLRAELRGDPRYQPGQALELDLLGYGCDGSYRVERASHEFGRSGYFVKLEAIWTGPKSPPKPVRVLARELPFAPPEEKPKGVLVRPRWKRRQAAGGDFADLAVDSLRLDEGRSVTLILESRVAGEWREAARATASIASGTAFSSAPLKLDPAGLFSDLRWTAAAESTHVHGEGGEVELATRVEDGAQVSVILERSAGGARWDEADRDLVTVARGRVKTRFDLEHPHHAEAARPHSELLQRPRWTQAPSAESAAGRLEVDAPELADGRRVCFQVERLGRDGKWSLSQTVEAVVVGGVASAAVAVEHSSRAPQPNHALQLEAPTWGHRDLAHLDQTTLSVGAQGLDGRRVKFVVERRDGETWTAVDEHLVVVAKGRAEAEVVLRHPSPGASGPVPLRFRAEVMPDEEPEILRFRAEPLPDLRPVRLRFRPELRVPESPGLTRLRALLVGGDEDQHCQTAGSRER